MKKSLIAFLAASAFVFSSAAFAKTEGNIVGIDILHSSAEVRYSPDSQNDGKFKDSAVGFGLNYKYAFNFNDLFVAPGAFAERLNTNSKKGGETQSLNYRYGAKLDLGIDVNDKFAAYFTNGFSNTHARNKADYGNIDYSKKSSQDLAYFYGAGLSFKATKDIAINLEYQTQQNSFKTTDSDIKAKTRLNIFKVGLAYNF